MKTSTTLTWRSCAGRLRACLVLTMLLNFASTHSAAAQALTVTYNFGTTATDGALPVANLIQGTDGTLYGTTNQGGKNSVGTVFRINTDGMGYATLYNFGANVTDGAYPHANLLQGTDGKLYGTTGGGGTGTGYTGVKNSGGTVFRINMDGTGYAILHNFGTSDRDGITPLNGLIQGMDGKLYGTTYHRGTYDAGTVFTINTDGTGYAILYNFGMTDTDGQSPDASLLQAKDGNLYGTTSQQGANGGGTVFQINTDGTGYATLYNFGANANDGLSPQAGLLQGTDGRLYGTTNGGGIGPDPFGNLNSGGTVFAINTDGTGYAILHNFNVNANDGANPVAGLLQGTDGKLYGTTANGGITGPVAEEGGSGGTAFQLNSDGTGYCTLYNFGMTDADSFTPNASLIEGADGKLYGTTVAGGLRLSGTVFSLNLAQTATTYLLWDKTDGTADLWAIAPNGTVAGTLYGPFTGYTAKAIAADANNHVHLLWANANGTADLWDIAPEGTIMGNIYGPFMGYTPTAIAAGSDNHVHLLWDNANGDAALWNIASDGTVTGQAYGPFTGYTATSLAVGPDSTLHLTWNSTDGRTALWNIATDGSILGTAYGPFPGYGVTALSVGSDNQMRLLWNSTSGIADFWNIDSAGGITGALYGPFPGFAAQSLSVGSDNYTRLLWNNRFGDTILWDIALDGAITSSTYGPFPAYTAVAVTATP